MRRYKKIVSLTVTAALAVMSPMQILADNPEFAHDEATWARLRDNVMEYDELQMLVEEYNPSYLNNQATYRDSKKTQDAREVRDNLYENAYDAYDSADNLREQAEDYLDMGMASAYAGLISAAISTENTALKTEQSADSSYTDSEMDRLKYMKQQDGIIIQTQGLFESYNQLKKTLATVEKNIELSQLAYEALEHQVQQGMATQVDLLGAKKDLQALQSTYTQSQSSMESIRQQLCLMTGWQYNAQPEIQDIPETDLNRIALMNPDVDKQTALDSNLDLKYNRRALGNMREGSSDKKNMERTIKNQEENIKAGIQNLYNDVLQKKTALELADAVLATESASMNSAAIKYQQGMISRLEYMQKEVSFSSKQIDRETADMALFQAMETYDWALKGCMN